MKKTKQELLERIEKLETITQKLEEKLKEILGSCSCITFNLPSEKNNPFALPTLNNSSLKEPICLKCYEEKEMKLPDEVEKHED